MNSCSRVVERAKPLLGTFVAIRVSGLTTEAANAAVSRGFAEIADVHRLMSFQDAGSDISRLNCEAHWHPVEVHAHTYTVLQRALDVSDRSDGVFDITVAPLVHARCKEYLHRTLPAADPGAGWRDIHLLAGGRVRFARALHIDVSGIAKGYAVDCAMNILRNSGATRACVNAGGDLAAFGREPEAVHLQMPLAGETAVPMVELRNESMATSGTRRGTLSGHVDGVYRTASPPRLVSVVAPTCTVADALTKVVAARGTSARNTLRRLGATALMSVGCSAWSEIG